MKPEKRKKLTQKEDNFQEFINNSTEGFSLFDKELRLIYVNRSALERTGEEKGKVIGKHYLELRSNAEHTYRQFIDTRDTGKPCEGEFSIKTPSGKEMHLIYRAFKVGEGVGVVTTEITSQKVYEMQLETLHRFAGELQKARSRSEIEKITSNIVKQWLGYSTVADTTITLTEKDATLSIDQTETMVTTTQDGAQVKIPLKEGDNVMGYLEVTLRGRTPQTRDIKLLELCTLYTSSAIERMNHERQIRDMRRAHTIEMLNGVSMVTSQVRHDLRTPLTTIKNAAYLLKTDIGESEFIDLINNGVDYAVKILEDLRFLTNPGRVNRVQVNLNALIQECVDAAMILPDIEITAALDPEMKAVHVDETMMRRVVDNLLTNAVHAVGDDGRITVTTGSEDGCFLVTVEDNGVGVSEEDFELLFTPFYTTKPDGMGLGLVYCLNAVKAHGGEIKAESVEGEWTRFTVKIPGNGA